MKLYNTLTRSTQDFTPIETGRVSVYSCGPTVYDHIHIGNLSAFIVADILRRTFLANGLSVHHVMNFTDVDDKTIRRSQEKYPDLEAMAALQKLTEEYSQIFLDDMQAVSNDVQGMHFVKATESIEQMQQLIRKLYDNKFAYIAEDGVYFSIEAYRRSGKIYGQLTEITDSSTSESRIQNDEYDKESVHDFALWKKQKPGEPAWDFELNNQDLTGRPGWHIECSAMSTANLGQPFDIHTGGVDLIFPHHENEIAQSTAGENKTYANFFVHNEHLLVDGHKMSKSLNNFYTLKDIQEKGYDPVAFRLLVLQSHYRSQAHFSWANLEAAQNRLKDYRAMTALRWQPKPSANSQLHFEAETKALLETMQNDLDSPAALASISKIQNTIENSLISPDEVTSFTALISAIDQLFGLKLSELGDISDDQKLLIDEREQARKVKDWTASDSLRDKLAEQGIGLRDTPSGPIWYPL